MCHISSAPALHAACPALGECWDHPQPSLPHCKGSEHGLGRGSLCLSTPPAIAVAVYAQISGEKSICLFPESLRMLEEEKSPLQAALPWGCAWNCLHQGWVGKQASTHATPSAPQHGAEVSVCSRAWPAPAFQETLEQENPLKQPNNPTSCFHLQLEQGQMLQRDMLKMELLSHSQHPLNGSCPATTVPRRGELLPREVWG